MHSLFNPFAQPLWITGLTTPFGVDSRLRRVPSYPHLTPRARFAGWPTKVFPDLNTNSRLQRQSA